MSDLAQWHAGSRNWDFTGVSRPGASDTLRAGGPLSDRMAGQSWMRRTVRLSGAVRRVQVLRGFLPKARSTASLALCSSGRWQKASGGLWPCVNPLTWR